VSEYTWTVPTVPSSGSGSGSGAGTSSSGGPTGGGPIGSGALNLVIDPIMRDLVDTADGWFLESTDSRTMVLWQLEATYQKWWGDPLSGSRIREIERGDTPADAEDLRDDILRALQDLVADGIISDVAVVLDNDEGGRVVLILNYRDRASGNLVDLAYVPFGG
jgi:phage gp46-like protein